MPIDLAARGQTVTCGALARALAVPGGSIGRLTDMPEAATAEDTAHGRPLRAAVCTGRLMGGLTAPGFFAAAAQLRRYAGPPDGPGAAAFIAAERAALFNAATKG